MNREEMDQAIAAALDAMAPTPDMDTAEGWMAMRRAMFMAGIEAAAAWHDEEVCGLGTGAPDTAQVHARSARALRRLAYQLAKTA